MLSAVFNFGEGLLLGFSLIIAIGAQNLFVFQQGIIGKHVFAVCLFCSVSDALLIYLGYSGLFFIFNQNKDLQFLLVIFGTAWLGIYGLIKIWTGLRKSILSNTDLDPFPGHVRSLSKTLIIISGITYLNPHVYLDTVILIGSIANTVKVNYQHFFLFGAISASFIFFFSIGYLGSKIGHKIKNSGLWKVINICFGVIMVLMAIHLFSSSQF